MLYAKKSTGSSWIQAISDGLLGLVMFWGWGLWLSCFSCYDTMSSEKNKLARYGDKAYFFMLFITNGALIWFSSETEIGDFDLGSLTIWSALLSLVFFLLSKRVSQNFVPKADAEANKTMGKLPYCQECQTFKVLRSVHDKHTNKCVYRFDHFNPWIRAPIGAANLRAYYFLVVFQLINSYLVWGYLGEELYFLWKQGVGGSFIFLAILWLTTGFITCSLAPVFLQTTYNIATNVTYYEVTFSAEKNLQYISFDPVYFNLFERKKKDNVTQFLKGYSKEKDLWNTNYVRPKSSDLLEGLLTAPPDVPRNEPTPQETADTDFILQWVNQPGKAPQ